MSLIKPGLKLKAKLARIVDCTKCGVYLIKRKAASKLITDEVVKRAMSEMDAGKSNICWLGSWIAPNVCLQHFLTASLIA